MAGIASGTRMGPYEVVSFLAAGGMGEVYRGHDARLGRPVAIKVLHESSIGDQEAVRRFDREARAAAAVSHPNLVSIYDVGQVGDLRYIVMDLLEGATLREQLAAGPMPWPRAVE
ncbi:MAG TPA: protein kinase, partial [Thermoanaerobaculia bacterium]|nr:protein kinase [Thermoanaerobaculia bacterium]